MKKEIILSLIAGIIIGFFIAGFIGYDISSAFKSNKIVQKSELPIDEISFSKLYNLDENHIYNPITGDEVLELVENKDNFILYIGRSTCPYCQRLVPELMNAAQNYNFDTIYHVDSLDPTNSPLIQSLDITGVPVVYFVKDGILEYKLPGYAGQNDLETILEVIYR